MEDDDSQTAEARLLAESPQVLPLTQYRGRRSATSAGVRGLGGRPHHRARHPRAPQQERKTALLDVVYEAAMTNRGRRGNDGGATRATEEGTWRDVARDIGRGMVEGVCVRMTRAGAGRGVANGLAVGGALEGAGWRKEVVVF